MSNQTNPVIDLFMRHLCKPTTSPEPKRQLLERGAVSRLCRDYSHVRVISGCAWVTIDEKDFILKPGDEAPLKNSRFPILISGVGKRQVVYEIA